MGIMEKTMETTIMGYRELERWTLRVLEDVHVSRIVFSKTQTFQTPRTQWTILKNLDCHY